MGNKKLKWEKTEAYNLALDFRLFNGRLNGTVETYYMSTTDVLVNRELPTITGYKRVYANLGEIRNKGFELSLSSTNMKQHNFEWTSNLIFSLNRNKIITITGEKYDVRFWEPGRSDKKKRLPNGIRHLVTSGWRT